jgi:hypothetical protein
MKTDKSKLPNEVIFENFVEINFSNVPMAWASDSQPWVHIPLGVREELKRVHKRSNLTKNFRFGGM